MGYTLNLSLANDIMARTGITKSEVFEAAQHIIGRGLVPTNELIRNHLGTGSNSTIAAYFREWKALQKQATQYERNKLPAEVIGLLNGVWERLYAIAQEEGEAAKALANQQLAELTAELDALKTSYQQQVEANDQLHNKVDALQARVEQQAQAIDTQTRDQEISQQQLNDKNQLISELKQINQRLQANLEHFHESARVQHQEEQAKHAAQLQAEQHTRKTAEQQLHKLQTDYQQLAYQHQETIKQVGQLNQTLLAKQAEWQNLANAHEQLKQTNQQSEINHQHLQAQHQTIEKKYFEATQQVVVLDKDIAILKYELTSLQNERKALKDLNQQLAQEKFEVLQEKAQLVGINQQLQSILEKSYEAQNG